jgi:integrase
MDFMMSQLPRLMDRAVIAALYLTGARPGEIIQMKVRDIRQESVSVFVTLQTEKLGVAKGFLIDKRILEIPVSAPYMEDLLKWHVLLLEREKPEQLLFPMGDENIRRIVLLASLNKFFPYNFRHSRLTKLALQGATISELMYWKGAKDPSSVAPYLAGKAIGRRLVID